MQNYTKHFNYLKKDKKLIYFDNASTTQKPIEVVKSITEYLSGPCTNIERSNYKISLNLTKKVDQIRKNVSKFINSEDENNIYFTSGSTNSIQKFVDVFKNKFNKGDEILFSENDHASLIEPICSLAKDGFILKGYANTEVSGEPDYERLYSMVNDKTKLIVLTHIHNIYGLKIEIEEIRKNIPEEVLILIDATQSVGHVPIDVLGWKVDGLVFSGHKMFALDGIGVLYLSDRLKVNRESIEKGTLPITGIISLDSAINFINKIGLGDIHYHNMDLTQYLISGLRKINGVEFLPGPAKIACASGYGVISFYVEGIPSDDLSFILDSYDICVRSSSSCMNNKNVFKDFVRVSMHINNTKDEVDRFINVIRNILNQ